MAVDIPITTWIPRTSLALFLDRIAIFTGCQLDESDLVAIESGIAETEGRPGVWYSYPLAGASPAILAFAQAENNQYLSVQALARPNISNRIAASSQVLQIFDVTAETYELDILVQLAFEGMVMPNQNKIVSCSAKHLLDCIECQETLAYFKGRHWTALLRDETYLPHGYADLCFLTLKARRFFFPAYLARALRDRDEDLLEFALSMSELKKFTPLQQELIEAAAYLPKK